MSTFHDTLTAPLLFLSSESMGWEDLTVDAFHEPTELEGWIEPVAAENNLILMTHGTMLIEVKGGKTQHIRQGDFFLTPAGAASREVRWKNLSTEPMQTLHMRLSHCLLTRTAQQIAERDSVQLIGRTGFPDPLMKQIGMALLRELEQPTQASSLYAQSAAQMLAVHLIHQYSSKSLRIEETPLQGLTPRQLRRVTDFVLAHLNHDLSLPQLAEQAGFSPYHFARLFRLSTGESPHQFVLRQRIEYAKRLLQDSELPLAHIALETGFANQSHLTQAFKRQVGITPIAYRKTAHFY